jgi:hypothetical protein
LVQIQPPQPSELVEGPYYETAPFLFRADPKHLQPHNAACFPNTQHCCRRNQHSSRPCGRRQQSEARAAERLWGFFTGNIGNRPGSEPSLRPNGITDYLKSEGTLEHAQNMAAHSSPCTTKLYDRRNDETALDEYEKVRILGGAGDANWNLRLGLVDMVPWIASNEVMLAS